MRRLLHARWLFITQSHQLDLRMTGRHPQQIAHVEVVKVDSGNAYFHEAGDSGEEFG